MPEGDIADIMRTQIEEPATRRLLDIFRQHGEVPRKEVERFRISVVEYRRAVLADYGDLDPVVRHELLKSLLTDYALSIDGLVERSLHQNGLGMQEENGREALPAKQGAPENDRPPPSTVELPRNRWTLDGILRQVRLTFRARK